MAMSSDPTSSIDSSPPNHEEKLQRLPQAAQEAFRRFQAQGDPAALDVLICAILDDYCPQKASRPIAAQPGTAKLIADLGFDSLAITEVAFLSEDLFRINVSNEELTQVQTLDDLRHFIRRKVTEPTV
jgi:acyl carrier protein